jgi:hypothetical protein
LLAGDLRPGGADNVRVLRAGLGLSRTEVNRLTAAGALTHAAPFGIDAVPDAPGMPRDADFAARLGLERQG